MSGGPRIRPAAVAGAFYPASAEGCTAELTDLFASTGGPVDEPPAKALIVPHAGWMYSGPVAATAYARLLGVRDAIRRVVILGPAHTVATDAMAVSGADFWETPLGRVAVDPDLRTAALACADVRVDDVPHRMEHCIEVQVPFLQHIFPSFSLLPIVVGHVAQESVERLLDAVWGGEDTLVVVSTDLSHYLDHRTAVSVDRKTAAAIVARDPAAISPSDACGAFPLRGLLGRARDRDLSVQLLDLRTSADTAGSPERVVGYGAFTVAGT